MNKSDVSKLLMMIHAAERRADAPSTAVVEMWFPHLAPYSGADAAAVISEHYGESAWPITLAALKEALAAKSAASRPAMEVLEVPDADPDDTSGFIAALRAKRWKPQQEPGEPPEGGLDLTGVFKKVPELSLKEVEESEPLPRRRWVPRRYRGDQQEPGE